MDLAKLESEVFLLGMWKNFNELEECLSIPELTHIIEASRDKTNDERKFLARVQGAEIDDDETVDGVPKEFRDLQAKVASRGMAADANDILAMQGDLASQAGFGIGMGLDFEMAGSDFSWG